MTGSVWELSTERGAKLLRNWAGPTYLVIQVAILLAGTIAAVSAIINNRLWAGIFDLCLVVSIQLMLMLHRLLVRIMLVANSRLMDVNHELMRRLGGSSN